MSRVKPDGRASNGGARPGAGAKRPPHGEQSKTTSCRLYPTELELLRGAGLTLPDAVRWALERHPETADAFRAFTG